MYLILFYISIRYNTQK